MTRDEARSILVPYAWRKLECYGGFSPDGDFCVASVTRGADLLDEHNYGEMRDALSAVFVAPEYPPGGGAKPKPDAPAYEWRASHWACGWVDHLMVSAKAPDAILVKAAELLQALKTYPVLNEDGFSDKEWRAAEAAWNDLPLRDRMDLCREAGISVFAARHEWIPADDSGLIFDRMRPE